MTISKRDLCRKFLISTILFLLVFISTSAFFPGDTILAEGSGDLDRAQYISNYADITLEAGKLLIPDDSVEFRRNLILASLFSTSFLFDQGVRDFIQDNLYSGENILSRILYSMGDPDYVLPGYLLAGSYSYLSNDRYFQDSLLLSLQSLIITQFYTELFKTTVARTRPRNSVDNPFERGEGGKSFFSGHASGSWAVMTVFADRYPDYSLPFYGLAAGVAGSRIYEDAHWFSDVLIGSVVGYGIGRLTISINSDIGEGIEIKPVFKENLAGLHFKYSF